MTWKYSDTHEYGEESERARQSDTHPLTARMTPAIDTVTVCDRGHRARSCTPRGAEKEERRDKGSTAKGARENERERELETTRTHPPLYERERTLRSSKVFAVALG